MRNVIAYYLLILYSIATCKPVLLFVNDFFAHTFWSANHLKIVHQNHGKNHVHYELQAEANDNGKDKNIPPARSFESVTVHIIVNDSYSFFKKSFITINPAGEVNHLTFPLLELVIPPPKV